MAKPEIPIATYVRLLRANGDEQSAKTRRFKKQHIQDPVFASRAQAAEKLAQRRREIAEVFANMLNEIAKMKMHRRARAIILDTRRKLRKKKLIPRVS